MGREGPLEFVSSTMLGPDPTGVEDPDEPLQID